MINEYKLLYTEAINIIRFIIEVSKIELANQEIESLFKIFVEEAKYKEHGQDLLYSFFMKKKISGTSILNHGNQRYLFESIMCSSAKINHSQLTLKAFHCFVYLFLLINMEEELIVVDKFAVLELFKAEDKSTSVVSLDFKRCIGNIITEVRSFAMLGHESLWKIICTTQYEDVLYQCEILLACIYYKLNVQHFNDQLIYETFFEKVIMLMGVKENNISNLLHLLTTFIEIYKGIYDFSHKESDKNRKDKTAVTKKPEVYFRLFRMSDPSNVLMMNSDFLNKVIDLLLYPDCDTVDHAIGLIHKLPILYHEKNESLGGAEEFTKELGFTEDDPHHVYFWLYFMKLYLKQAKTKEEVRIMQKFEIYQGFNISLIIRYLKQISEMDATEAYKIPLLLSNCRMLMKFVVKLQRVYTIYKRYTRGNKEFSSSSEDEEDEKDKTTENLVGANEDAPNQNSQNEEEKIDTAKDLADLEITEKIEFHHDLISNFLAACVRLVFDFSKDDKIKNYLVKMNFLQKGLKFISNRIERFLPLFSILCDPKTQMNAFFSHLFLQGQKFRGHKIVAEFIDRI